MALESVYNPKDFEVNIYNKWKENKVGKPENQFITKLESHSILMPPPNLTGDLHAGHSFQHFLMDSLCRYERMQGKKSLWFPGVDHAGLQLEGVIDKLIVEGEFDNKILLIVNARIEEVMKSKDRSELARLVKKNNPDLWLELAWSKADLWRDNQKKQAAVLGDTPDYSRQLFTLDDKSSVMVNYAFKQYWEDGLLYKNRNLINWSVGLQTALSEVSGDIDYITRKDPFINFYYKFSSFKAKNSVGYEPVITQYFKTNPLVVATVRPETIHGDMGVAIHPDILISNLTQGGLDMTIILELIKDLNSKNVEINFGMPELDVDNVKLIVSSKVDKNFGTGILKITPASDMVDFEIWVEDYQGGMFKSAILKLGILSEECGHYQGQKIEQARLNIIYDLAKFGYVPLKESKELSELKAFEYISYDKSSQELRTTLEDYQINFDYEHNVTICERSKTVVEPLISDEIFISMTQASKSTGKSIQQHGLEGMREVNCYSQEYQERGLNFINSLKDWCISRNLIWGHQFPVWYNTSTNPDKIFMSNWEYNQDELNREMFFVGTLEELKSHAKSYLNNWVQDDRRLDTWFSSSLWPLTTFDYLEYISGNSFGDFGTFYPTTTMTTAKEIFNIWVCRMVMLSKYFTSKLDKADKLFNTIPFKDLVITPTVLDDKGKKMSKSLGNGLDPAKQIDKFSSDALRMAMMSGMIPDRNMKFGGVLADKLCEKYRNFGNKVWNIIRFMESKGAFTTKFDEEFEPTISKWWLMDKYYKMIDEYHAGFKNYQLGTSLDALYNFVWNDLATWHLEYIKVNDADLPLLAFILKDVIQLLSPFMPFESEVLFTHIYTDSIYPSMAQTIRVETNQDMWAKEAIDHKQDIDGFQEVINTIEALRSIKGLFGIPAGNAVTYTSNSKYVIDNADFIKMTSKCELSQAIHDDWYQVTSNVQADVLTHIVDKPAEIIRTNKQIEDVTKQKLTIIRMLENTEFIANASIEIIASKNSDLDARNSDIEVLNNKLKLLSK
jgi:valyl-tRNA synthetase